MAREWLPRADVAALLGVPKRTVDHWCEQGLLEERREAPPVKPGECECGCGQPAPLAGRTWGRRGWKQGQPVRFVLGHHQRTLVSAASVQRLKAIREARDAGDAQRLEALLAAIHPAQRPVALLAARATVAAAWHRVAVLAHAGEPQDLLEATEALVNRRAQLTLLEAGRADG